MAGIAAPAKAAVITGRIASCRSASDEEKSWVVRVRPELRKPMRVSTPWWAAYHASGVATSALSAASCASRSASVIAGRSAGSAPSANSTRFWPTASAGAAGSGGAGSGSRVRGGGGSSRAAM